MTTIVGSRNENRNCTSSTFRQAPPIDLFQAPPPLEEEDQRRVRYFGEPCAKSDPQAYRQALDEYEKCLESEAAPPRRRPRRGLPAGDLSTPHGLLAEAMVRAAEEFCTVSEEDDDLGAPFAIDYSSLTGQVPVLLEIREGVDALVAGW